MKKIPVTIANGDGIGPEIMQATLKILTAAETPLEFETIEIGKKPTNPAATPAFRNLPGIRLKRTHLLLKAPITTPQGGGYKSLNVTLRKASDCTLTYGLAWLCSVHHDQFSHTGRRHRP